VVDAGALPIIVAIDLGGTVIKVGVVEDGVVTARATLPANSARGLAPALPRLRRVVDGLVAGRVVGAVGLAMPGLVDRADRRVRSVKDKWTDAPGLDLQRWAMRGWSAPLSLENDAVAALAGEWRFGAAAKRDAAVMITLGTGIGTAAVVEGRLLRGSHGQATIGAHFTVAVGGRQCSCGNQGCAEAEASTLVLPMLARLDPRFPTSALAWASEIDYREVFRSAPHDPLSADLRDRAVAVWSALAVTLVHAYDPEVVVLGGGLAAAGSALTGPMAQALATRTWTPWGRVELRAGLCGSDAALLGVAVIAASDLEESCAI
jgi:glucokinase